MSKTIVNNTFVLKILNFATFMQYQRFIVPISYLFYLQNGLTFSDFIFFQSIFNITCLLTKIPMGFLGDIIPKKFILIISYFLFMLRVILWLNFSGYWILLTGEILYGLFKALYRGNIDSYIYEYLQKNNMKTEIISKYGKLSFFTSIGSAISCVVGVILYKYFGFKVLLMLELVTQIIAISALFLIPNIKTENKQSNYQLSFIYESIKSLLSNKKINYYVYYSAMVTGLTNVFVWNFQPLLKATNPAIIMYAVINFINQALRGAGGIFANKIVSKFSSYIFFRIQYLCVIASFILLLFSFFIKNWIFVSISLILICIAILFFVVFNIFTISKIHEYTQNYKRATTSSTNTFIGDFASFAFLFLFKQIYDITGFQNTILIFLVIFMIALLPNKKILQNPE